MLAAAGLLQGRRVATHWNSVERLAAENPGATVEPDAIYVKDGPLCTSAGVTAGMDLALAMVEEDHGRELALRAARRRGAARLSAAVHLTGAAQAGSRGGTMVHRMS